MMFRIVLAALVLVTASCNGRIEFKMEKKVAPAKIEKAVLKVENLVAKLKDRHDAEEYIAVLPNIGREFAELPAPHPVDLPETHPKDLPDAEQCYARPRDLPIGELASPVIPTTYFPAPTFQYDQRLYSPVAPGIFEIDAIKTKIDSIGLDLTRQQLERTKSDLVDAKLEILRQRDQLRDLEIDVRTLKSIVGELLKRK